MRLIDVLDEVNQIEKNAFIKVIDSLAAEIKDNNPEVANILSADGGGLKNIENANLVKLFEHCKEGLKKQVASRLQHNDFQFDLLLGIFVRDGNSIMSREWFGQLYAAEIDLLKGKVEKLKAALNDDDDKTLDPSKKRDYRIYHDCVDTAYHNDEENNLDAKITSDEKSVLVTLSKGLGLSAEEARELLYCVVELQKLDIDFLIDSLKKSGIVFYRSSKYTLYIPDEFVWLLRDLCGNELSTKHFRRILRNLKDSQINRIARSHSIDNKLDRNGKIRAILAEGISLKKALNEDIFKEGVSRSDKRDAIQDIIKKLDLDLKRIGSSAPEKVDIIIDYYQAEEREEYIGMSAEGYSRLLAEIKELQPALAQRIKDDFELQQEDVMRLELMQDYAIKPIDVVDLLTREEVEKILDHKGIKKRGDARRCLLEAYKDVENILMENYELIAARDINALKEKDVVIKEAEFGSQFEELTKKIFGELGFTLDEEMRKQFDGTKTQPDILLKHDNDEIAIVECKTIKDAEFKKYSSVTRQLSSYVKACEEKGQRVSHCILISSGFTDEFIAECEYDYNLHLSLLTASGLQKILAGFKESSMTEFPQMLFKKSGLIDAERVLQVINK